jgi:hypothetical protein
MTTATLRSRGADLAQLLSAGALLVERKDVRFADFAPGRVGIDVTVRNAGGEPSAPTVAVIQAAPLGAFVPWRPLAVLPIPALGPGEDFVLRTEALRPAPAPLGPPDRVPPRRLLTALMTPDDRPRAPMAPLPPDLAELLGHRNAYWAGNLNVFVGDRAVERHTALALRIYPGHANLAMFVVGSARPDAYRFHTVSAGDDWGARLYDMTDGRTLRLDTKRQAPVEEERWVEAAGQRLFFLAMTPPGDCGAGSVEVHVTQRSTGQEAVVEFSLDPSASGPGCFVL